MTRSIPIGEVVSFTTNTGQEGQGTVIQRIAERRQPVILLIEQASGWRCFRLEDDVTTTSAHATAPAMEMAGSL
jgi:hypothetical protein